MFQSRRLPASCVLLAVLVSPACLGTGSSINAYGGVRSLDSDDLDEIDEPTVYGADAVLKLEFPMLAVEGGWLHAEDDASTSGTLTDVDLTVDEYFVGLRITPWDFLIEPYGAVGVNLTEGDLDATSAGLPAGDSDSTFGYYARIGAGIRFGFVRLGLDARANFGDDVDLDAVDTDLNGQQITGFVGIGF